MRAFQTSILLAAGMAFAASFAPALAQSTLSDPIGALAQSPPIKSDEGASLTFDGPLQPLAGRVRVITYEEPSAPVLGSGVESSVTNCARSISTRDLVAGARKIFGKEDLQLGYNKADDRIVVVLSRPTVNGNWARFYSYIAEVVECRSTCTMRVAANLVSAPTEGRVILLSRASTRDDEITGQLLNLAEPLFSRCVAARR